MHTMWKGSISFGLVNIPVKMFASVDEKDVRFRYLHRVCRTPVKMVRMCPHCNIEVPWEDVVKGYEYGDGKFVLMEKDELTSISQDRSKVIEIIDFVELKEIDPIYFNKTYYLGAQDENNKAYALLRKVLQETNKIGVAQVTIRSKKTLAVIRVYENCLVMETIFYPDEIRNHTLVPNIPEETVLPEKELKMAQQLIDYLTTDFDPKKYTDEYRVELEKALEKKIGDEEIVSAPGQKPEKVVDLMAALQASIEATRKTTKKTTKASTKKKKATS